MSDAQSPDLPSRLSQRVEEIRARYPDDPVVQEATAGLDVAIEELNAATEQLAQQSTMLEERQVELAEERERWRRLFDFAPDAFVVTDEAGVILEVNRRAETLLDFRSARSRPRLLVLTLATRDRPAFQRMLRDSARQGATPVTVMLASSKSADFRGELQCVPVAPDRLLWLLHDVSAAERARELLESAVTQEKTAAEQLRSLDEMRRAFLLAASHDLRTPIAAIAGFASLLKTQDLSDDDRLRALARLEETSHETVAMLTDLLDYERIEDESTPIRIGQVDIVTIVKHTVSSVSMGEHRLDLDLTPTPAAVDAAIVERIVANLLRNAVQHTPAGTTISVRCRREPDGILLVVEDDGPGIAAAHRSAVFDLFHRDRTHERASGLGVGLALVRRFAELHGGYARVEERPGGGASFHVLLRD